MNITDEKISSVCTGCSACVASCPKKIIYSEQDEYGFFRAKINDKTLCVDCGKCVSVCPAVMKPQKTEKSAYYAYAKNSELRSSGSSGGVFTAIAHDIVNSGGVAFGAVLSLTDGSVAHTSSDKTRIENMSKSKYVQSNTSDSFLQVKAALDENRSVLFCGTPCQVAGLKSFLGRDYPKLLTIDFVCHGVPSPKLFFDYLNALSKSNGNKPITEYDFRSKKDGWGRMRLEYRVGNKHKTGYSMLDSYTYLFEKSLSVNPSCLTCCFSENHTADIVVGDLWTYRSMGLSDEITRPGISLCLGNSKKGIDYLKSSTAVEICEIQEKNYAYAFRQRNKDSKPSRDFYEYYSKNGYDATVKKYVGNLLIKMIKSKLKLLRG